MEKRGGKGDREFRYYLRHTRHTISKKKDTADLSFSYRCCKFYVWTLNILIVFANSRTFGNWCFRT